MWYAQHGEDRKIVEFLKLGASADGSTGFYVDIGAWEPTVDSVTKHFYDRGWRGINVEPIASYFEKLVSERPRDINLCCAISDTAGSADMVRYAGSGLSSLHPVYGHDSNWTGFKRDVITVPTVTLDEVLGKYAAPVIDFMKIDVEGWEGYVLRGNDWQRFRPRLLVIEATVPGTDTPAWEGWDEYVVEQDYAFMLFDGLNRYYMDVHQ